jgi:uncharacterized paraquat-inducible protein A
MEDRCLRCMQPLPAHARRCPNCRTPRPVGRGLPIFLGIATLIALIVLVFVMVKTVESEDSQTNRDLPEAVNQ